MRITPLLLGGLLFALLTGPGCAYSYKFKTGLPPTENKEVSEWRHIFIWGWTTPAPYDLEVACPEGVSEFGSYVSFPNWLCAFTTLGIYSPRTVWAIPAARKES